MADPKVMGDVWDEHGHRGVPCSPPEAVHGDAPCRLRVPAPPASREEQESPREKFDAIKLIDQTLKVHRLQEIEPVPGTTPTVWQVLCECGEVVEDGSQSEAHARSVFRTHVAVEIHRAQRAGRDVVEVDPSSEPAASEVGRSYVQGHGAGFSVGFDHGMRARRLLSGGQDGFVLHETATDDRTRPCTSHVGRLELAVVTDNGGKFLAYRPEGDDHWQAVASLAGERVGFWTDAAGTDLERLEVRRRD